MVGVDHIFQRLWLAGAEENGYGIEIGATLNLGIRAGQFQDLGRGLGGTTAIEVVLHDGIGPLVKGMVDHVLALGRAGQIVEGVVT
jgi:hypothetical protein